MRILVALLLIGFLIGCEESGDSIRSHNHDHEVTTSVTKDVPANERAKGLVFDGLIPGKPGEPCAGIFQLDNPAADRVPFCTHGPDPAPIGVDVRVRQEPSSLSVSSTNTVPCIGDGTSGYRVQAIYARASDKPDNYAAVEPLIKGWAAEVSQIFLDSAAEVGGERHVPFVTDANCELVVDNVVLSPTGDDTFSNTRSEMRDLGYNNSNRKYLIWMDANVYCGIGTLYGDDRPGQENYNNTNSSYSRTDNGCWGSNGGPVAAHELTHNLGGVQRSAPNATPGYHCTDEYDRMCYKDASDVVMDYNACPGRDGRLLDCNHDDYYHPNPPANSYLDTHWNTADSQFLVQSLVTNNQAPTVYAGLSKDWNYAA